MGMYVVVEGMVSATGAAPIAGIHSCRLQDAADRDSFVWHSQGVDIVSAPIPAILICKELGGARLWEAARFSATARPRGEVTELVVVQAVHVFDVSATSARIGTLRE